MPSLESPFTTSELAPPLSKESPRQIIIHKTENFLASPIMEKLRKLDQMEPDEIPIIQDVNKVLLLVPILEIERDINNVQSLLKNGDLSSIQSARKILSQDIYLNAKIFKKTFNLYSDNIFYTRSDTRRANLYLSGGTTPDTRQTEQYLYRNAALTAVQNVQDDLKGLEEESRTSQGLADAIDDCREVLQALGSYFERADPSDLEMAKNVLSSKVRGGDDKEGEKGGGKDE